MNNFKVEMRDEVEMKIDDDNYYVQIDIRKYTLDNQDICVSS